MQWGVEVVVDPISKKIGQDKAISCGHVWQMKSRLLLKGYANEISLEGALDVDTLKTYARQATGEKYLINPSI